MTENDVIKGLSTCLYESGCNNCPFHIFGEACKDRLMNSAIYHMEQMQKIIREYQKADLFLAAHGWKWEEVML